jgi:putative membrane protein
MRLVPLLLAIAGLALAIVLFAQQDVGAIIAALVAAGPGLVLAALFHVLPMIANARAWQRLISDPRPGIRLMSVVTWIRESVNGLLPVARVGGEVVAYRVMRAHVEQRGEAAASLIADMGISVLSQASFGLFGLALLFALGGATHAAGQLIAGVAAMIPLGVGFALVQRSGTLSAITRFLDRFFAGRLAQVQAHSQRIDQALRALYGRQRDVSACFLWQLAGWTLGAGEMWLALYFLGHPRSGLQALTIEALIQAVSSAAFLVPAAIGVQEGAFILIAAALGIDTSTALSLAAARRLRDLVVFFPGLIAWQWAEAWPRHASYGQALRGIVKALGSSGQPGRRAVSQESGQKEQR